MKKYIVPVCVLIVFFLLSANTFAFTGDEHNKYLQQVILGREYKEKLKDVSLSEKVELLECASYLAIDQYNKGGVEELDTLKEKVEGVPDRIEEIDFSGNSTHRVYTHKGWDNKYYTKIELEKAHWDLRKNILTSTTKQIWIDEDEKSEAFAQIVYLVHILGDHIYDMSERKTKTGISREQSVNYDMLSEEIPVYKNIIPMLGFAGRADKHDVVQELLLNLEKLFPDQLGSKDYILLRRGLKTISNEAGAILQSQGGLNSNEKFFKYYSYSEDAMELLIRYFPKLLERSGLITA